jgi:hypothetical protein
MIFCDANLTVHGLVHKESKGVGISRLSLIVLEIKALYCFLFLTVHNCNGRREWRTASLPRKVEEVLEEEKKTEN